MSSRSNKIYFWLCFFEIVIIAGLIVVVWQRFAPSVIPAAEPESSISSESWIPGQARNDKQEYTLLFVGDIMLSRNIAKQIAKAEDPLYPFLLIASTTRAADLTFANLETPVSATGTLQGSIYSFRSEPVGSMHGLQYAGFDVVSLANNHIWDYGRFAALDTMKYLREAGIDYVGFGRDYDEANTPVIKQVGDTKVAFLGYTEFYSKELWADEKLGLSEFEVDKIAKRVAEIKESGKADVVVVSLHWGVEYETKSNAAQQRIAHQLVDAGADLIIGHHPHVPQELEKYSPFIKGSTPAGGRDLDSKSLTASGPLPFEKGEGYIAYSLGNFVFDQNFSADTKRGLMLEVTLKDKKIIAADTIEIGFTKTFQPYILSP